MGNPVGQGIEILDRSTRKAYLRHETLQAPTPLVRFQADGFSLTQVSVSVT